MRHASWPRSHQRSRTGPWDKRAPRPPLSGTHSYHPAFNLVQLHVILLLKLCQHAPGRSSPSVLCRLLECLRNIQDFEATPSFRTARWPTECSRRDSEKEGSQRLLGCLGGLGNTKWMHYTSQFSSHFCSAVMRHMRERSTGSLVSSSLFTAKSNQCSCFFFC